MVIRQIELTEEQDRRLEEVASRQGRSVSELLRERVPDGTGRVAASPCGSVPADHLRATRCDDFVASPIDAWAGPSVRARIRRPAGVRYVRDTRSCVGST